MSDESKFAGVTLSKERELVEELNSNIIENENFAGCRFNDTNIVRSTFKDCLFGDKQNGHAKFHGGEFNFCKFIGGPDNDGYFVDASNYDSTVFSLADTRFIKCKFVNMKFAQMIIYRVIFSNCEFESCTFEDIGITESSFTGCTFTPDTFHKDVSFHGVALPPEHEVEAAIADSAIGDVEFKKCSYQS